MFTAEARARANREGPPRHDRDRPWDMCAEFIFASSPRRNKLVVTTMRNGVLLLLSALISVHGAPCYTANVVLFDERPVVSYIDGSSDFEQVFNPCCIFSTSFVQFMLFHNIILPILRNI